jgi:hypothetical protein
MKKTRIIGSLIGIALAASLTACGAPDEKVSFDTLETQRAIANDNGRFNALKWRAENGYESLGVLVRGDSTQQANCPQGDGWSSIDLVHAQTKATVIKLKCSTVSMNVGCMTDADFKARTQYASQENSCNPDIPKNLKKIEQ